jgi:hypothetical protein
MAASSSDDSSGDIDLKVFLGLCDGGDLLLDGLGLSSSELDSTAARRALTLERGVSGAPPGDEALLPVGEDDLEEAIDM